MIARRILSVLAGSPAMGCRLVLVLGALLWPGLSVAQQPPQTPFLRIAAEGHTQVVNRLARGAEGRIVATVSDDKTLRIWKADTGEALATLRVPIGAGKEGELYAVAISPDGKTLLAGGQTGAAWDGAFSIYIFDVVEQRMKGRLPGLPGPVNHLAFSPDGSRFAAALGGGAGVRLYDARDGGLVRADADGWGEQATWVAFDAGGRYAATGFDGGVRLYSAEGARVARRSPVAGGRAYSVAFAPGGDVLAVGYADQARVELVSARDLAARGSLAGPDAGGLGAVAWGGDGRLFAAGSVRDGSGSVIVRSWAGGRGRATDWAVGRDTVFQVTPAGDGGVLLATADPALVRVGRDGGVVFRRGGPGLDFRDLGDQMLSVSADGLVVELRAKGMASAWRVDMGQRTVVPAEMRRALTPVPAGVGPAPVISGWRNGAAPVVGGRGVKLEPGELARSYAVTPDQAKVVIGTDYQLRVFTRDGAALGVASLPAAAWAVRVSGDGRSVVAAVGDGTLRWFGLEGGGQLAERFALFLASDGQRWVAWTPDGLFDHADRGGKELVGVQLNRARGQGPDWFSFAQAYRLMYAPDAVGRRARGEADPAGFDPATIGRELRAAAGASAPPEIELVSVCWTEGTETCRALSASAVARGIRPSDDAADVTLPAGLSTAVVRYRLKGEERAAGPVDVFVNGRNANRAASRGIRPGGVLEQAIPVDAGLNQVHLRAYNGDRLVYAQSRVVRIRREAEVVAAAKETPGRPRLYVLSVGVDKYRAGINRLAFAVADARAVAAKVRANVPTAYAGADVTELYDEQATTDAVVRALERIGGAARSEDTVLVYLSGHGINSGSQYFYVTQNVASVAAIPDTALSGARLVQAMAGIKARNAMLFLDTCYAGKFSLDSTSQLAHESGRYVLAAASQEDEALDSYDDRNGVFATAVLRGMSGAAVRGGAGLVSNFDLGLYVAPLVGQLAKEKQHSQSARFKIAAEDAQPFNIVEVGVAPKPGR